MPAIRYYTEQLDSLNEDVDIEQHSEKELIHSGFVTFNSLVTASVAMQSQVCLFVESISIGYWLLQPDSFSSTPCLLYNFVLRIL